LQADLLAKRKEIQRLEALIYGHQVLNAALKNYTGSENHFGRQGKGSHVL
jgi:hypothetical protein